MKLSMLLVSCSRIMLVIVSTYLIIFLETETRCGFANIRGRTCTTKSEPLSGNNLLEFTKISDFKNSIYSNI